MSTQLCELHNVSNTNCNGFGVKYNAALLMTHQKVSNEFPTETMTLRIETMTVVYHDNVDMSAVLTQR